MAVNNNQHDHHSDKSPSQVTVSRGRTSIINASLSPTPPVADLTSSQQFANSSRNSKCHSNISPVTDVTPQGSFDDEDDDTFPDMLRVKSEEYSKRIAKLQEEYLIPLKEDLADWINRITESAFQLSPDNFMDKLDNGVIICKLAKLIESQVDLNAYSPTTTTTILPTMNTSSNSNLQSQSVKCTALSTAVTTLPSDLIDVKQVPINGIATNGHLDAGFNGDSWVEISSSSNQKQNQQESMADVDEVNANSNKGVSNSNFLFNELLKPSTCYE